MTLNQLQEKIKAIITKAGFRYVSADKWFNLELGIFPTALINSGYSVQLIESTESENEDDDSHQPNFKVEFMLDPNNDLYLKKIDDAIAVMKELQDDPSLNADDMNNNVHWQSFTLTNAGSIMALTFNQIKFEI